MEVKMCKILVVDDDPDFVEITRMVLQKEGHTVITAPSGDKGLEVAQRELPEIVLLDVMMDTVLDGLHVSHELHKVPDLQATRVIMVTSIMDTDNAALFPTDEYLPVDAWLTKPIDPQKLIKTVNQYCTHKRV
jgi:two-component system alkaline phosphatase synthesis response regulator PhoP